MGEEATYFPHQNSMLHLAVGFPTSSVLGRPCMSLFPTASAHDLSNMLSFKGIPNAIQIKTHISFRTCDKAVGGITDPNPKVWNECLMTFQCRELNRLTNPGGTPYNQYRLGTFGAHALALSEDGWAPELTTLGPHGFQALRLGNLSFARAGSW